jgi:hypothetical protein
MVALLEGCSIIVPSTGYIYGQLLFTNEPPNQNVPVCVLIFKGKETVSAASSNVFCNWQDSATYIFDHLEPGQYELYIMPFELMTPSGGSETREWVPENPDAIVNVSKNMHNNMSTFNVPTFTVDCSTGNATEVSTTTP